MNGNFNIDTFYIPSPPLAVSPVLGEDVPTGVYLVNKPLEKASIHYDLTIQTDNQADMSLFIQKMEQDLRELKKRFLP